MSVAEEGMMTDHKHEWDFDHWDCFCIQEGCDADLTHEERARRLNACEELTAEDARMLAGRMATEAMHPLADAGAEYYTIRLLSYADKLGE